MLDELLAKLGALPDKQRKEIEKVVSEATKGMRFIPNVGPQTQAYLSKADVLLYGGAAGGGKSAVLVGIAENHHTSVILRRESVELDGIEKFARSVFTDAKFNGTDREFSWGDKSLKLGGCKDPDDWRKHAGRARDFLGFDEGGEFLEEQVSSLMAWNRSPIKGQRCRVVIASNPPRGPEGEWLLKWFQPWLDEHFPNRAVPGELRWAVRVKGELIWLDGPERATFNGEEYIPLSYTFIPAFLSDNPANDNDEYRAKLQSLAGPLRAQLLYGDFTAGKQDAAWQVIPTDWVVEAQRRWKPDGWKDSAMSACGLDVGAGRDETVLAPRHGGWFAPLETVSGEEAKDPAHAPALVVRHRKNGCGIVVDMGGGFGGPSLLVFKENGIPIVRFNGSETSSRKAKGSQMSFANKRAEAWWRLREELDPTQQGGSAIALPPDAQLKADLTAPTWKQTLRGIQVESKEDIRKRIGRSPDRGDAVVMALAFGEMAATIVRKHNFVPKVIMGRDKR